MQTVKYTQNGHAPGSYNKTYFYLQIILRRISVLTIKDYDENLYCNKKIALQVGAGG